jgi:acyl-CoA dehydrogenase
MSSPIFNEEHSLIRDSLRRFVDEEVVPHAHKWEVDNMVPRPVLRRMGEHGFLGMRIPVEYGGAGMDARASVILAEETARSMFGGFAITVLVHTDMASPHIINAGSEEQKKRFLPAIARGEKITAIAVTEPDAGSDVAGLRTKAVRDGNKGWVLNGAKMFITNGVHADLYVVAARTDPESKGSRGLSMFLVEKGTPGFRVGRALQKQGWACSDTAELVFEDVRVPDENLLGGENRGFYAVMQNFQNERLVVGAMAVSECLAMLRLTVDYVMTRKAFGATLWDKQVIRQRLSMLAAKSEAARQLVHHTGWLDSQGRECVAQVSMLKALCGELVNEVAYTCQQFHGGFGYIKDSAIERMVRDVRVEAIGGGATEVMLEEVAKRIHNAIAD